MLHYYYYYYYYCYRLLSAVLGDKQEGSSL